MTDSPSPPAESSRRLALDAYAMTVSSVSGAAAGLLVMVLAANFASEADVGRAVALTQAVLLLSFAAQLDLGNALHRYLPGSGRAARPLILKSYLLAGVASVVVSVGFIGLYPGDNLFQDDRGSALLWFTVAVVAWSLFSLQDHVLICLGKSVYVPVENILFGLFRIGLLLALVGFGTYGIFASMAIPTAVTVVVVSALVVWRVYPFHVRSCGPKPPQGHVTFSDARRFALGSYPGSVALAVMTHVLGLVVLETLGEASTAHFQMAWLIAFNVDLVATNFGVSLVVQGATNPSQLRSLMVASLRRQIMLIGPAILVLTLFSYPILSIFDLFNSESTNAYAEAASDLLKLLALSLIPRVLVGMYVPLLRIQNRLGPVFVIQVFQAVVILGLSSTGPALGGLTGLGWGYLAAQTVIALVLALPMWRAFQDASTRTVHPEDAVAIASPPREQ